MKIGDILSIEPTLEATSGLGTIGPIPARVIYIHPAGRYYTVEFRSPITGYNWREAFCRNWNRSRRTGGASRILRP